MDPVQLSQTIEQSNSPTVVNSKNPSQVDLEKNANTTSAITTSHSSSKLASTDVNLRDPVSSAERLKTWLLLPIICSAQFFDIFTSSSALVALPQVHRLQHYRILRLMPSLL